MMEELERKVNGNRINGSKCVNCGMIFLPSKPICKNCSSSTLEMSKLPGEGTILKFEIFVDNKGDLSQDDQLFVLGLVKLSKKTETLLMPIVNVKPLNLQKGMRVRPVWREGKEIGTYRIIAYEPI